MLIDSDNNHGPKFCISANISSSILHIIGFIACLHRHCWRCYNIFPMDSIWYLRANLPQVITHEQNGMKLLQKNLTNYSVKTVILWVRRIAMKA